MVGRGRELDRLVQLATGADAPAVALIGGEAGIGKTRLVRELLGRMGGAQVLAGQADPGSLGRPFSLVLDATDDVLGDDTRAAVLDDARPMDERVAAMEHAVAALARSRPTVVVFDDLHWADAPSVAVFERLAEPASGPVLLLATYRPDALTRRQPAGQLVPRLERRRAVTHLHLDRLRAADVAAFLTAVHGHTPSYRVIETLHARTGGNPYFLEELLAGAGGEDPEQLTEQPLPWSVGELVRGQLDDLDHDQRRIVEAAAVLGARVSFDLLAAVTATSEDDLIDVLRTLVARGLLVETQDDLFSFRHAIAREAIEAELLGREKRRLHEQALAALCKSEHADAAAIAHHAHGAGRYDEMVEAAREGAQAYLRSGSTYQALQLAELGLSEAEDDIPLLGAAARAAWLAGLPEDAIVHAEHLLAVARREELPGVESAALRRLVRLRWEVGDRDAMQRCTDELVALTEVLEPGEELGNALACIAQSAMLQVRPHEAIEWADRAIALADELGDAPVRVWAQCEKGSALLMLPDRMAEGMALLEAAADEAEALGEYVVVARALNNRVRTGPFRRDPAEARALLARMRHAAECAGFDSLSGPGYWEGLASLAEWDGDIDAALGAIDEGHRRVNIRGGTAWYGTHEAGLALEVGDIERAEAVFGELQLGVGNLATSWYGLAVHIAARRGDLDEARRLLPDLVASVDAGGADGQLLHDVTSGLLAAGASAEEVRPLVTGTLLADDLSATRESPWRSMLAAQLREAAGDHAGALAAYDDAAANGDDMLGDAPTGTALVGAARCLVALGRAEEARERAARAGELLARWRGWRVDDLHAIERRLGMGRDVEGPDALTPREREVVALLADGLSNAELAARLYISPKTAAVHVSNILAKLGMTSRAEIAAFAAREQLPPP